MKDQILKLAGVKTEKQFYKKFPTEEAFMKVHGKAFKKAAMGASMVKKQLTQLTDFDNPPQAEFGTVQSPYSTSISGFGKQNTSLDASSPRALGDLTGSTDFGMRNATNTSKMFGNFQSGQAIGTGLDKGAGKIAGKGGGGAGAYIQAGVDVVEGISMIKGQNQAVDEAEQNSLLTGVQAQAVASKPRDVTKNYYARPEDVIIQPEQLFPSYGTGSNILSAQDGAMIGGNPTELQNTYDPNSIYTNLEYEPLNDSDKVKSFYSGGYISKAESGFSTSLNNSDFGNIMQKQGGGEALDSISNLVINKGRGPSAGSKIGGGIGQAAGTAFFGPVGGMVGKFAGQALGSLIDSSGRKIEKYDQQSNANIAGMMGNYIPQQFGNVMEDGGYVSHNWQPQVIAKFGEYDVKDLLVPDETMDTLRTGGNLRQNQLAMGGELQVYRGEAEPISTNPYLPDGGETIMFRGPSHENGGMPISYGQSPVEVEGGEPAVKLRDGGGEDNLVVFGNLKIDKQSAEMLGDPKLKNKKFKNYINDLSKIEAKQNRLIDKSSEQLALLDPNDSFDKLKLSALESNLMGANMKLKDIAGKKQSAAALQSAINDTAEEYGLVADDLAQGKIKKAKLGAAIRKAEGGDQVYRTLGKNPGSIDYNPLGEAGDPIFTKEKYQSEWVPKVEAAFADPVKASELIMRLENYQGQDADDVKKALSKGKSFSDKIQIAKTLATDEKVGPYHYLMSNLISDQTSKKDTVNTKPLIPLPAVSPSATLPKEEPVKQKFPWISTVNQLIPYLRPSDAEALDPKQLIGEMYALSQNQLEPVQAQSYQPQLQTPYDISLQDQLNEVTAQTRQAERLAQNNPAALASINAEANMAKSRILGEQMRVNQAMKSQIYGSNIDTLNQAKLQNLQIYDTQQQRQEAAKSNTKATTQAALNSIASKYAQNKLENRELGVMENLYNYRYDKSGRAINMNPLVDFDAMIANATPDELTQYKKLLETKSSKKESTKKETKESRNGSIVKAIKNL